MRHAGSLGGAHAPVMFPALVAAVVATVGGASPAHAQITDVTHSAVADISRLTFGQLCENRFIVRNDGARAVDAELAVARSGRRRYANTRR